MPDEIQAAKVTLSFICSQDWNQMEPCAFGKFCASCQKTVFDLSQHSSSEIMRLQQVQGAICGRFHRNQVQVQNKPTRWRKFITSFLISLGLTGINERISAQTLELPPAKSLQKVKETDFVFGMVVETMPSYKNGENEGLQRFIYENLQNPTRISGSNVVSFVVDTLGRPVDVQVLKSLSKETDLEAIRVAKLLEFIPATQQGKKVPSRFTIRMDFFSTKPKGFKYKGTT